MFKKVSIETKTTLALLVLEHSMTIWSHWGIVMRSWGLEYFWILFKIYEAFLKVSYLSLKNSL